MLITDFIKEYKESRDKIECVKNHITERYIPYEQKMAVCKNIIEGADYTSNINGLENKYYSPNTPMRFVLFCMSLVDLYTDIELEQIKDGRNVMGGFNLLDSNNVFEVLFQELNREYKVMDTVLRMMIDDTYNKESSLVGFLSSKYDSLEILYNTVAPIVESKITEAFKKEN